MRQDTPKFLVFVVGVSYSLVMSGLAAIGLFVLLAVFGEPRGAPVATYFLAFGCVFLLVCLAGGLFLFRRAWALPWRNAVVGALATAILPCLLLFGGFVVDFG
ncbi:MAG: hypothetical protein D6729_06370 [Deltaproteobacteria bacterium]|nr:MAG: hypothetical protein D6729_06370 [Deltaproteobacteria bacterium]